MAYVLALDQGTTSSRAMLFDARGAVVSVAQQEFEQLFPAPDHVEHDPEAIWASQLATAREAIARAGAGPEQIAAVGVTNQRETTVLWDRITGRPIANAVVWQSRVTVDRCEQLKRDGLADMIRGRTGLVLDPYFSATKIAYLLDTVPGARRRAERGDILFGTVDSFLIWRLTGGRAHVTDTSNASRTLLFNIHSLEWDDELLRVFGVPRAMLPAVTASSGVIGTTDAALFGGGISVSGIAGDQQAALFGQTCFETGQAKNTYGTGCFLLMHTGATPVPSSNGLLTTVGWTIQNQTAYCLEGSVFVAGAAVQWLRDGLGLIKASCEIEPLAARVADSDGVYFVPAFVGLGAPHWDPHARGLLVGLTRRTTAAHIARATVESMAYQTKDVLDAMQQDARVALADLQVDGGAAVNDALLQFQADLLGVPVRRPLVRETTALGAAYLAGLAVGFWPGLAHLRANWALDREFTPQRLPADLERQYAGWTRAVERARGWAAAG